jgi:glycosyltransferase involved in cell wall biosynthesis
VRLKPVIALSFFFFRFVVVAVPEISVVIPVYNTVRFLPDCLESVLNQTFEDIEIICVDDGSTDDSLSVLQEYAKKDPRIKIFSQKNAGVSAARNVGLENTAGKYVLCADSDDTADPGMLKKLHDAAVNYECDIAMCDVNGIARRSEDVSGGKPLIILEKYMRKPARNMLITACWNKIYKRSVIGFVRFNERVCVNEDLNFNLLIFSKNKKAVFLAERLYNYREHSSSLSKRESSEKQVKSFYYIIKDLYQRIGNTLEEKDELKKNVLNDLAIKMFCLAVKNKNDVFAVAEKVNELYTDKIIDLNMEYDLKIYAVLIVVLGKAVNFIKGLANAF